MKLKVQPRWMIKHLNNAGIAQLVEQFTCNEQVEGSSPSASSKEIV